MATSIRLKYLLKEFWANNLNKAFLLDAILLMVATLFFAWIKPLTVILWVIVFIRAKEIRKEFPNKCWLIIFIFISSFLESIEPNFAFATLLFTGLLFVPEKKWSFLKK